MNQGKQGDPGERGPQGEPGHIPSDITRSFILVVAVAFIVLLGLAYQVDKTRSVASDSRKVSRENSLLVRKVERDGATIRQLQQTQAASCKNFETLKDAVNDFHGTIKSVLKSARDTNLQRARNIHDPKLRAIDLQSVRTFDLLLARTHTVSATCAQKPVKRKRGS